MYKVVPIDAQPVVLQLIDAVKQIENDEQTNNLADALVVLSNGVQGVNLLLSKITDPAYQLIYNLYLNVYYLNISLNSNLAKGTADFDDINAFFKYISDSLQYILYA